MLVLPAILLVLLIFSLPRPDARTGGVVTQPPRTARTTTPGPSATPEPTPTFNYGHTPQTATAITPGLYNGNLTTPAELDYFRFDARANVQITIEYKGNTLTGGAVALLIQVAASGVVNQLAEDTDTGSGAKINHTTTQAGVYYIRVRSTRGDTGAYSFGLVTTNR